MVVLLITNLLIFTDYPKNYLPLPSSDNVTAKAPESINVSYILIGKTEKRQVAANITWIQTPWRDMSKILKIKHSMSSLKCCYYTNYSNKLI